MGAGNASRRGANPSASKPVRFGRSISQRQANCSSILPLAEPEYTHPNLFINVSDAAAYASEHGKGHIANYDEID